MSQPFKLLLRAPNWLGDHILAIPLYDYLATAARKEHVQISLLHHPRINIELPYFHEFIPLPMHTSYLSAEYWKWIALLKNRQFQTAVSLPSSHSALSLMAFCHIPQRIGFRDKSGSSLWLTESEVSWKRRDEHKSARYLRLARHLWFTQNTTPRRNLTSHFSLSSSLNQPTPTGPFHIILAPEASNPLREWPFFLELALHLERAFPDARLTLVGQKSYHAWEGERVKRNAPWRNLIGQTSLADLRKIFRGAHLLVANDSGLGHLAAWVGLPSVLLFGPGRLSQVRPLSDHALCLSLEGLLPCCPCDKTVCHRRYGYQTCLIRMKAPWVFEHCKAVLLRTYTPK